MVSHKRLSHLTALYLALLPTADSFRTGSNARRSVTTAAARLSDCWVCRTCYPHSKAIHGEANDRRHRQNPAVKLHQTNRDDGADTDDGNGVNAPPTSSFGFLSSRIELASPLEVRLDATLAAIYVYCRFLIYDVTTGIKSHPGWEVHDVVMLLQTTSSAAVLSLLWTTAGLMTRLFEEEERGNNWSAGRTIRTAAIAAPIWLLMEIYSGWPPAGIQYADGSADLMTLVATGCLGLSSVMLLGKFLTVGWR